MIPTIFRMAPALAAAAAFSACSEPTIGERNPPPVCGETFALGGVAPLADSLLVIEQTPTLSAEQAQRLAEARAQPAAGQVVVARLAGVPERMLELGHSFVFSVSLTRSYVLVGMERRMGRDGLSWYGHIANDRGEAILLLTPEGITGRLLSIPPDRSEPVRYSFHPLGGGLHAVICIDPSKLNQD
jgi:hypothetical protein